MVATKVMAAYCFDVILADLEKKDIPRCPLSIQNDHVPLVITWKNLSQEYIESNPPPPVGNRGSSGIFTPVPLHDALPKYALLSAFEDPRFDPVTIEEVPQLHCSLSIINNIQPISDYHDWTIGRHGLHVYYEVAGEKHSAYYLPEVPREKEWTKQMTIDNLIYKSGFDGEVVSEQDRKKVHYERYEADHIQLSYEEYYEMKASKGTGFIHAPRAQVPIR
ncbi:AMMECR1 domain containing protein [Aphelenchoides avenae]|nr:AMMECR1 domain containing protein [Aphelenchus avenae]